MAFVIADRVQEKSTAGFAGLGPVQLAGVPSSPAGRLGFVVAVGDGNSCPYWIDDGAGAFEIGIGTVAAGTPDTLSRDLVVRSSALNNAKVDFAAGVKDVVSGPFAAMFEQGPSELTLADGAVTLRGRNHTIDTEGDAAAGDLVSVGWGAIPDGHTVSLLAENAARIVTVKSRTLGGAGNVYLRGGDKRLSTVFPLVLQRRGNDAVEVAPPGGDGWVTLQTQDPAGVSSCDFTEFLEDEFDVHRLVFVRLRPASDGATPQVQVAHGGSFTAGTGYAHWIGGGVSTGASYATPSISGGTSQWSLSVAGVGNLDGQEPFNGVVEIYGARMPQAHFATWRGVHGNINGNLVAVSGALLNNVAQAIDGARFFFSAGNITSGRVVLQGLRRAS